MSSYREFKKLCRFVVRISYLVQKTMRIYTFERKTFSIGFSTRFGEEISLFHLNKVYIFSSNYITTHLILIKCIIAKSRNAPKMFFCPYFNLLFSTQFSCISITTLYKDYIYYNYIP